MNVAIIDDEENEAGKLSGLIREYAAFHELSAELSYYNGAEEFLKEYAPYRYTAVFMDIYMDGLSGIEASERITKLDPDALIVFVTSSGEHMSDAFRLHAYDYLAKPVERERVFRLLDDILKKRTELCPTLDLMCGREEHSLKYSEILSACADGHNVEVTDTGGKKYRAYAPFYSVADPLNADKRFLLINRGVLVNMDYILQFSGGTCRMTGNYSLPVNLRKSKTLEQTWQNYMFTRVRNEMTGRS